MTNAAEAVRILTTGEEAVQRFAVPHGCAQRDGLLFSVSEHVTGGPIRLIELACRHGCDVIDLTRGAAGELEFGIGVTGHADIVWHDGYRPWRGPDGASICFVPPCDGTARGSGSNAADWPRVTARRPMPTGTNDSSA